MNNLSIVFDLDAAADQTKIVQTILNALWDKNRLSESVCRNG